MQQGAAPRYEFLDALRALAVLGVMAVHCAKMVDSAFPLVRYAWAGTYGVQLFFMISAFTIFLTLERSSKREKHVFKNFFIRRILRIVPMFWIASVLYCFVPGRETYQQAFDIGFVNYFLTAILQHGWTPYSLNSVVPGGWSIAVEATFYLIAPVLFLVVTTWRRAAVLLLVSLLLCAALNGLLSYTIARDLVFVDMDPQLIRFFHQRWFPSQLPVFAFGLLCYLIWRNMPAGFSRRRNGVIFLIASLFIVNASVGSNGLALLPEQACFALGFVFLVLGLAIFPWQPIVNGFTSYLGRISYSFYLLHFCLLALAGMIVSRLHVPAGLPTFAALYVLTFLFTIPAATLTAHFIEQPFVRLSTRIIRWLENEDAPAVEASPAGLSGQAGTLQ